MIWLCDGCNGFVEGRDSVELVAAKAEHLATNHSRDPKPEDEEVPDDVTVLDAKYLAWGLTALLALFATRWPQLGYLLPFTALIAFVLTYHS